MAKKIYVGNLPWSTTSATLETLFAAHGAVRSAEVISDRETGRSRGFGFVEMETDDGCRVVGTVNDRERRAWQTVYDLGRAVPADVAPAIGTPQDDAARVLDGLHRRRLLMRLEDGYVAVGGLSDRRA